MEYYKIKHRPTIRTTYGVTTRNVSIKTMHLTLVPESNPNEEAVCNLTLSNTKDKKLFQNIEKAMANDNLDKIRIPGAWIRRSVQPYKTTRRTTHGQMIINLNPELFEQPLKREQHNLYIHGYRPKVIKPKDDLEDTKRYYKAYVCPIEQTFEQAIRFDIEQTVEPSLFDIIADKIVSKKHNLVKPRIIKLKYGIWGKIIKLNTPEYKIASKPFIADEITFFATVDDLLNLKATCMRQYEENVEPYLVKTEPTVLLELDDKVEMDTETHPPIAFYNPSLGKYITLAEEIERISLKLKDKQELLDETKNEMNSMFKKLEILKTLKKIQP